MEELTALEDDGLITPEIGSWGEEKYRLVELYSTLFAKSMRKKWECLVYIDLFSGAGRSRIRGTKRIVNASPLIVLGLPVKFDRYIFCERDRDKLAALKKRVARDHMAIDVKFVEGNANDKTAEIMKQMPEYGKGFRVLAFCFVDPFGLSNLQFVTIRALAERYMDFLVLIPSGMQAHRFESVLIKEDNTTVADFLGQPGWRALWQEAYGKGISFERFIVEEFGKSMEALGYLKPGFEDTKLIRSDEKNLLLYRLVIYSRHPLGKEFWQQAKKYSQAQGDLF